MAFGGMQDEKQTFCYTRQALIDKLPSNRGLLSSEMRRGEFG
jgi:hypothetical protein